MKNGEVFAFTVLALLLLGAAAAQSIHPVADMAVAESEYRDAQAAWLRNDPDLERDLYKRGGEEMRTRVHRAAGLRDDMMSKKEIYLGFLASHFDSIRSRLAMSAKGSMPVEQLKLELQREQERLLSEEERLESQIHDLPESDENVMVRHAYETEKTDLISLQNSIALRIRSLDRIDASQRAEADSGDGRALAERLDEIGKMWAGEHDRAIRERANWARYYKHMEDSLSGTAAPQGPVKKGKPPKNRDGQAPLEQPAATSQTPAAARFRSLEGAWAYASQPGAWTGFGEPEAVRIELKRSGADILGTYVARLPGLHDIRELDLTLRGHLVSEREAKMQWLSLRPAAHGEIELKLGFDGRLLVERLTTDDSYIPAGTEVLQPQ